MNKKELREASLTFRALYRIFAKRYVRYIEAYSQRNRLLCRMCQGEFLPDALYNPVESNYQIVKKECLKAFNDLNNLYFEKKGIFICDPTEKHVFSELRRCM